MSVISQLRASGVECYTRAGWGSPQERAGKYAARRRTHPMPKSPALYHFLHITVTPDTDTIPEGAAGARKVETYGLSTPPMVSYQDLVTNEGRYYQGQDYGTKGTHTINDKNVSGFPHDLNLYGYALAIMQNVGDEVTDIQVDVIAMVFAARELLGLVVKGAPIYPHRKFAAKSCPGDKAVFRLGEIERLRDQYVRDGLPGSRTPPPKEPKPMNDIQRINEGLDEANVILGTELNRMKGLPKNRVAARLQVGALWAAIQAVRLVRKRMPAK